VNVSAILVVVPVERIDDAIEALEALPGVEVHHTDPATGRMIVIQEAQTVDEEVDGLVRIKRLPNVVLAEMVYHHFEEEDGEIVDGFSADPGHAGSREFPPSLNE
jgi:nitrate reductase NapD